MRASVVIGKSRATGKWQLITNPDEPRYAQSNIVAKMRAEGSSEFSVVRFNTDAELREVQLQQPATLDQNKPQTIKSQPTMKKITSLIILAAAMLFTSNASAAFNELYGMGNPNDSWLFTGRGVTLPAVASVNSNALYYVTSAYSSGAPKIERVWVKGDLFTTSATLSWYLPADVYTLTNTGAAGTNTLYMDGTNALASGSVLVIRNASTDEYQMLINSNNTIFAGNVVYGAITNGYSSGDKVYRMVPVATVLPLATYALTNGLVESGLGQWISVNSGNQPMSFHGRMGEPALLAWSGYTNANLGLIVSGEYYVRQRR